MNNLFNANVFEYKLHSNVLTALLLLLADAFVYFIPYRNDIYIGKLFGVNLWFYFGLLNGVLILAVYIIAKGDIILDFNKKQLIFKEFKTTKVWDFDRIMGIYLLASDFYYILRIRPQKLKTFDIKLTFEQAYELLAKFEELNYKFKNVKNRERWKTTSTFPLLISKYEKKPNGFNAEIGEWNRSMTLRTKLLSITMAPLLYIIGATLVIRIPHLLEGLRASKGIVSFIYGFTAFVLFDGGLYLLFGISFLVMLAKQLARVVPQTTRN